MITSLQEELLQQLKQKGILTVEEYRRAELFLYFTIENEFVTENGAVVWLIENKLLHPTKQKEYIARLNRNKQKPPLVLPPISNKLPNQENNKNNVSDGNQLTTAFALEQNERVLYRCYYNDKIDIGIYKQAYQILGKLSDKIIKNEDDMMNWLVRQNIIHPSDYDDDYEQDEEEHHDLNQSIVLVTITIIIAYLMLMFFIITK